ncbi:MAG TPA: NAD-dependent succinate-semialdehyde dehydrogenase [bacterium]|nr:NAD-dependent succinate-semialdehyde dehydrogenase [bacterium]
MRVPNQLLINGHWKDAADGRRIDVIDPATEEAVDSVPAATPADIDEALASAAAGWRVWRETDAWTRSATVRRIATVLREHTDEIARVLTEEQGKPLAEARGELAATADQFDWYADEARRIYGRMIDGHSRAHRLMVIRQPVGPVAAFSPWNFPALLAARKVAPALAAGCSVILKPAIEAPRTGMFLALAAQEAGVPAGVFNVLTGPSGMISERLIRSDVIRKVTLTGSVPVGQQLLHLAAEGIKSVTMELGGHSPVLVFADADVEAAAETCALAKFRNNGQVCIAASRFYVQENVIDRFTKRFVEVAQSLKIGDGRAEGTQIGPLTNQRRVDATQALVDDAVGKGARVAYGGKRPDGFARGYFYLPTVLTGVDVSMDIMTEEPFCPIAPIAPFTDLDDALAKANASQFGLAGYVFTDNTRTAFLASEGLDVGMIGVNNLVIAAAEIPFGGVKMSGYGREGGSEGIEYYTVAKYINFKL